MAAPLEDPLVVEALKARFAPDGGAEREHNAAADSAGFGAIHYALVRNLRPRRALVIGSRYGYVPAFIALALRSAGGGRLDFVDGNYSDAADGFSTAFGGVSHWTGDASAAFRAFDLDDVVDVHVMRSSEFFARCTERYGYIYLDGDHSYDGCRQDVDAALKVADEGAIITLHDIVVTDPAFGVGQVFAELSPLRCGTIAIAAWPGLGIVQVR